MQLYVNIYTVGRASGGPEEGGWFYDYGTPISAILVEFTEAEHQAITAYARAILGEGEEFTDEWLEVFRTKLREKAERIAEPLRTQYAATGKRSSVLGGEDYEVVIEDHFARAYPEEVPTYA